MKVFVFTDTHGSKKALKIIREKIKKSKPDMIICLGDFTIFGHDQKKILTSFDKFNKEMLLIHGNHEDPIEVMQDCDTLKNVNFIDATVKRIGKIVFVAWGGGGFSLTDSEFKSIEKA